MNVLFLTLQRIGKGSLAQAAIGELMPIQIAHPIRLIHIQMGIDIGAYF